MAALLSHSTLALGDPTCRNITGDAQDVTLKDYLAHLFAQAAEARSEGVPSSFNATCKVTAPNTSNCRLMVRVEAEDPWEYGVSFELQRSGVVPAGSLSCPGRG